MNDANALFRRHGRRLFSVLRAIVRRSSDSTSNQWDYAARVESRIAALCRVHEMIMRSPGDGIDLEELVHGELLAQAIPSGRYRVTGPDTRIGGDAGLPIALALHELAVNSVLHGVLVDPQGLLDISWNHGLHDGNEWLRFGWEETARNGLSRPPTATGFGLEMLERMLPFELDAKTRIQWLADSTRFEVEIPGGERTSNWHRADGLPPP